MFETEDQRNWTDASFKTYGTPLELPFPVSIENGTRVRQSVRLRFVGQRTAVSAKQQGSAHIQLTNLRAVRVKPSLGFAMASHGQGLTAGEMERLKPASPGTSACGFATRAGRMARRIGSSGFAGARFANKSAHRHFPARGAPDCSQGFGSDSGHDASAGVIVAGVSGRGAFHSGTRVGLSPGTPVVDEPRRFHLRRERMPTLLN